MELTGLAEGASPGSGLVFGVGDSLSRKTAEAWYDDVTDADAEQNVRKTYSTI